MWLRPSSQEALWSSRTPGSVTGLAEAARSQSSVISWAEEAAPGSAEVGGPPAHLLAGGGPASLQRGRRPLPAPQGPGGRQLRQLFLPGPQGT